MNYPPTEPYEDEHGREIRLTVNALLGNAAFETPADAARALRKIADRIDSEGITSYFETILDDNGNDVGRWKIGPAR